MSKFVNWIMNLFSHPNSNKVRTERQFIEGAQELTHKLDKVIAELKAGQLPEPNLTHVNHAYVYPPDDLPLLQAYEGKFEACYVLLHPFSQLQQEVVNGKLQRIDTAYPWQTVVADTEISDIKQLYRALPKSIMPKNITAEDAATAKQINEYLVQKANLETPYDGAFEDMHNEQYIAMFREIDPSGVIYVPSIPHDEVSSVNWDTSYLDAFESQDKTHWNWINCSKFVGFDKLESAKFPFSGTVISHNFELLLTVESNRLFSLFYGERKTLEKFVKQHEFEGFFADDKTTNLWYV